MLRKTHLLLELLICVICNILRNVLVQGFFPFSKLLTSLLYLQVACQHPASGMLDGRLPVSVSQPLESSAPVLMAGQRGSQKTRFPSSSGEERSTEVSL